MQHSIIYQKNAFFFKKWTRKKYGIYNSLGKDIRICTLVLSYLLVMHPKISTANSDTIIINNKLEIEEVEVIGRRSDVFLGDIARFVSLIRTDEIQNSPVQSPLDILEHSPGVDIRQRGNHGVQADVNIRGGSFDHSLILIDGINITDPQTGHLSLDIPLDINSLSRIEILNGPGARIFGSNAFTGAINFVTTPIQHNKLSFQTTFGDFGFRKILLSGNIITGTHRQHISISNSKSNGYAANTDFQKNNIFYKGHIDMRASSAELLFGYNQKAFGSNGFYSPKYPEQYEKTSTWLAAIKYTTGEKMKFNTSFFWRRKNDHYILIRSNPGTYQNFHITDVFGTTVNNSFTSILGKTSLGSEIRSENIISNNLGLEMRDPVPVKGTDSISYSKSYTRGNISLFLEQNYSYNRIYISAGVMINRNTDYSGEIQFFPGADISYLIINNLKTYISYNRAVHMPTFTDLFYQGPVNEGNMDLSPDLIQSFEAGIKYVHSNIHAQAGMYYNHGKDIIDWLWYPEKESFSPVNLSEYASKGIEITANYTFPGEQRNSILKHISVNYTYINVDKSSLEEVSKYYNLRQKMNFKLDHHIIWKISAYWSVSFQDRTGNYISYNDLSDNTEEIPFHHFWLFDSRLYWQDKFFTVFIEASNLLNTEYLDTGSLEQPGRWLRAGIKLTLCFDN